VCLDVLANPAEQHCGLLVGELLAGFDEDPGRVHQPAGVVAGHDLVDTDQAAAFADEGEGEEVAVVFEGEESIACHCIPV
jgi:hypothetical protein